MNETPRVSLQKRFERNYPLLWTNLSRLNGLAIDLNKFSPNEKKVEISSIFKWFKQDFKSTRSKLTFRSFVLLMAICRPPWQSDFRDGSNMGPPTASRTRSAPFPLVNARTSWSSTCVVVLISVSALDGLSARVDAPITRAFFQGWRTSGTIPELRNEEKAPLE